MGEGSRGQSDDVTMATYTKQQIDAANHSDLAAFLLSRGETVRQKGREALWEKHQVWVNGSKWYSHYDAEGGYAIDFVMRYFGLSFPDAVRELLGKTDFVTPAPVRDEKKSLVLPDRNPTMNQVYAYLMGQRFITRKVVSFFAHGRTLYEDARYHNCVFVGLDEQGQPRHCHMRSTTGDFKLTVSGSDAAYSFHHDGEDDLVFVFEAPIDLLAYLSLHPDNWQKHSYVALCSVSEKALLHQLEVHPNLQRVVLCLDNDTAGRSASERIGNLLRERGYAVEVMIPEQKDWDEDLKSRNGSDSKPAGADHTEGIRLCCHEQIAAASAKKKPTMLTEKLRDALTGLTLRPSVEKVDALLSLLLWQTKEEYRKSLSPVTGEVLEEKLCALYDPLTDNGNADSRLRRILAEGKTLLDLYADNRSMRTMDYFIPPLLKLCMTCIEYLYHEGSETM